MLRLNPTLARDIQRDGTKYLRSADDILHGVCSRFNVNDIVYFLRRYTVHDLIQVDQLRRKNFQEEYNVKVRWVFSPETETILRDSLPLSDPASKKMTAVSEPSPSFFKPADTLGVEEDDASENLIPSGAAEDSKQTVLS